MEVACPYCGVKLSALEEQVGMRGKCQACGHTFFIPDGAKLQLRQQISEEKKRNAAYWEGKTDEEIADALLSGNALRPEPEIEAPADKAKAELIKKRQAEYWASMSDEKIGEVLLAPYEEAEVTRPFFLPRYDDITLFTLGVTFVLLLAMSGAMREEFRRIIFLEDEVGRVFLPLMYSGMVIVFAGMALCLVNAFLRREKSDFEKFFMLVFAVVITAGTGIYAGIKMLESSSGWMLIFPLWNILTGGFLLLYLRGGIIDTECITDEAASMRQIAGSVVMILILLIFCHYVFRLHWVYTYSIAICYMTSLQNVVQDWTTKIKYQK